jgi:hypothetical protein
MTIITWAWAYSEFMNYSQIYVRAELSNFKPLWDYILSEVSTHEPHYKNILFQIYAL